MFVVQVLEKSVSIMYDIIRMFHRQMHSFTMQQDLYTDALYDGKIRMHEEVLGIIIFGVPTRKSEEKTLGVLQMKKEIMTTGKWILRT